MCLFVKQQPESTGRRTKAGNNLSGTISWDTCDKFEEEARGENWEEGFHSLSSFPLYSSKKLPNLAPRRGSWRCRYSLGILSDKFRVKARWGYRGRAFSFVVFTSPLSEKRTTSLTLPQGKGGPDEAGMLMVGFGTNPQRRLIWTSIKLYLTLA